MTYILLVDDDRAALSTMANALGSFNYTVERALTPEQAQMMFHEQRPDLVILEVSIGHNKGWALLDEWVRLGARVLVLSRFQATDALKRALEAGATDVMGKPFVPDELTARVATRLKQAPPKRAVAPEPATDATQEQAFADHPAADSEAPAAFNESRLTLGEQLRIARKQRNISLVQANLETNIQMYYIQALEEDRYGLLPRGQVANEIVKKYAAFLGQDSDQMLAEFRAIHHDDDPGPRDLAGQPVKRQRVWLKLLALLFAALLSCATASTALALLFPDEIANAWNNTRAFFTESPASEAAPPLLTPEPTADQVLPTLQATPEATLEATPDATRTPIATQTPTP